MGLFSSSRNKRPQPAPVETSEGGAERVPGAPRKIENAAERAPSAPPRPVANPRSKSLRDELHELFLRRPPRETFAGQAAELIAGSAGIKGAAILAYQQRPERLRLIAQVGLEDDAVRVFTSEARAGAWEIPLRSVRNRRINVIESAHENPFVPPALAAVSPRRLTIAVMPFYHGHAPLGVAVLFSPTQRGFADNVLQGLSQALRVCAAALAELPPAAGESPRSGPNPERPQPTLLRGLAALRAELSRLTLALEEAERKRAAEAAERVSAESFLHAERQRRGLLEKELEGLRAENEQLPTVQAQFEGLTARLAEAARASEVAGERIRQLESGLSESEGRERESRRAIAELAAAREELEKSLESALANAEASGQTARELERRVAEQGEQIERLGSALKTAESAHDEADRDLVRVRQETAALEAERARVAATLEQSQAALRTAESEQEALSGRLVEIGARVRELEAGHEDLGALRERLAGVEAARASLAEELEKARASLTNDARGRDERVRQATARLKELEAERGRLLEELSVVRQQSEAALGELRARVESEERQRQQLGQEVEALRRTAAERDRLQSAVQSLERELESAREVSSDLETRLEQETETGNRLLAERTALTAHLEEAAGRSAELERERGELSAEAASLREEQQRLLEALAEKELLLQSAEEGLTSFELSDEDDEAAEELLAIDRSSAATSDDGEIEVGSDEAAEEEAPPSEVVLLESEQWAQDAVRQLTEFGHRVLSLPPDPGVASELAGRTIACAAINLAAASSWRTVRHIRNGAGVPHAPMVAYALATNAPKGFWLGSVDFALLPVADNNLGTMLRRMVPRLRRVLAMSSDIDVVSDVRTQLTETDISTAVVLDGRQALDLVSTVRPEAAVLHLSPGCVDVFRTIAGLRAVEAARDIPILFLLDHEAGPSEEAFLTAGVRTLFGRGNLAPGELVDVLASALDPYRAA